MFQSRQKNICIIYNDLLKYQTMDANTKAKIVAIRDLIKKKQYQQALTDLEVLMYKYPKLFQAHLMAGLCYQKLGNDKDAEKSYLQVLDIKQDEPNAMKALCDLYSRQDKGEKASYYLELHTEILKKSDPIKYKQAIVKLVKIYQKNQDMQKIDKIFQNYLENETDITEDFMAVATSYFRTGVKNQCFFLQKFEIMGIKDEKHRKIKSTAREQLNILLIDIIDYLESVRKKYDLRQVDISNSIFEMKQYFPEAASLLMLMLLDEFCISHTAYSTDILREIYYFLSALYDRTENYYLNLEVLDPEIFTVCMLLGYEYLAFFKQFFSLDPSFDRYFDRLCMQIEEIPQNKIRPAFVKVISKSILRDCRTLSKATQTQNVEKRLTLLKDRISRLDNSFLEQVVAKMAMNCFTDYQQLNSMKNMLKVRVKNLGQEIQPHLYKYYFDYLLKISKIFKVLDEEISIYQVIEYIFKHDPADLKYKVQYYWMNFCKHIKKKQTQEIQQTLLKLSSISAQITDRHLKSECIRKKAIISYFLNGAEISDDLKIALGNDRSFQNLQCLGFYYFGAGNYKKSLVYLKEAFILNQNHYHLNRGIFVALVKENQIKEGYNFLERIYEGFKNVFWVNYMLGLSSISQNKLQMAEKYLITAIQAFKSATEKDYKFSYQKTLQKDQFSLFYMIDQNQFVIMHDELIIPQEIIYKNFPIASSLIVKRKQRIIKMKLSLQIGEVLKILGRTKSAFNYLSEGYEESKYLSEEQKKENKVILMLLHKQYGTILFYMRSFKQAQQVLKVGNQMSQKQLKQNSSEFLSRLSSEIKSLLFQVSVERLNEVMKFESYEAVNSYIESIPQYKTEIPTLNYLKSKYQYSTLCYLHNKNYGVQNCLRNIEDLLSYLKLDLKDIRTDKFQNQYVSLNKEERVIARECLEDYYILLYLHCSSEKNSEYTITSEQIMLLIQMFPMSTPFYIVYGMTVEDLKLKIASFIKCIQIDKESPISVDLLASLYLKQKNYITACKLFLKCLELEFFNPKCHVGLCVCLLCVISQCYKDLSHEQVTIIQQALNRINSYMEFLKIVNPSENYQIIKFLKMLLAQEEIPLIEIKQTLQYRKKSKDKHQEMLLYKLLDQSTSIVSSGNIWKVDEQVKIVQKFIARYGEDVSDKINICFLILKDCQREIESKPQNVSIIKKWVILIMHKLCIAIDLALISKQYNQNVLLKFFEICSKIQLIKESNSDQISKLKENIKNKLYIYALKKDFSQKRMKRIQKEVFLSIHNYDYMITQKNKIPDYQKLLIEKLHLEPAHPILRKALVEWLTEQKKHYLIKLKTQNYRCEIINQLNGQEEIEVIRSHLKKLILLYSDNHAWIATIIIAWNDKRSLTEQKLRVWIKQLERLSTNDDTAYAKKTLFQMYAYAEYHYKEIQFKGNQGERKIVDKLIQLEKIKNSEKVVLSKLDFEDEEGAEILLSMIWELTKRYKNLQSFYETLKNWNQYLLKEGKVELSGYCSLLRFWMLSKQNISDEDLLLQQLKELNMIIIQCEQNKNVSPYAITMMKCSLAVLTFENEQLEMELQEASQFNFVSYSDQIIINFYEIIRAYRELNQRGSAEGVYENFLMEIEHMIGCSNDPFYKGFFLSLKAMGVTLVSQEEDQKLNKDLKRSILLAPTSAKSLLA